ncbi:hypothetical protein F0U59_07590 [Archangium gephyra]|nr:hypothetical protein F0U59_07590 [Archangium gephyra]
MNHGERFNPFPGPQPYRMGDRRRFFGREDMTGKLVNRILAHPCVTLFGPSGAGKTSLMQAAVIPLIQELHGFRTVRVDAWLATGTTPLEQLVVAMFLDLELGERPTEKSPRETLDEAIRLAERYSSRPILIYLDQLEQLLYPSRSPEETDALLEALAELARMPLRGLQLVLSLREDYLGRFRDRVRGQRLLQDPGFRLGPLTVGEMAQVACQLAEVGEPAQQWSETELRQLMLQVRTAGQAPAQEAEIQTAYAQIVCRALWEERVAGGDPVGVVEAEPILHRYLEATLEALGPLRADARNLLEEHLISRDGSRTLLTEREALNALREARNTLREDDAERVLGILEGAAVLRAEEHQGSRYFELGHDWLATKVLEFKRERIKHEKAAEARRKQERERRLQQERSARRRLTILAAVATGAALLMCGLLLLFREASHKAIEQADRAFDQSVMAGAREKMALGQPALATKLLLEARHPDALQGWRGLAQEALDSNFLELTLSGSSFPLNAASFSPDGRHIITASQDGTLRSWMADGTGEPVDLGKQAGAIQSARFSPDGQYIVTAADDGTAQVWSADGSWESVGLGKHAERGRTAAFSPDGQYVVTASSDMTARVWSADGSGELLGFSGHTKPVTSAAFSPDGMHIVTTSYDGTARVWLADGTGEPDVLRGHEGPLRSAAYSPDGQYIVTASDDGTARVWLANGSEEPVVLRGHDGPLQSAMFSPDGQYIVTASNDGTARVWRADGLGEPLVFEGHEGPVRSAEFSPDGQRIVTASWDKTARVWRVEHSKQPLVLRGQEGPVRFARFSPDGRYIVMASQGNTAWVWRADGSGEPDVLEGHEDPVTSAAFSPDGQYIVTTSWDKTARVWRADGTEEPRVLEGHADSVTSAAFSPDGQYIVTASIDGTAWVWRTDGLEEPRVLEGHKGRVTSAAFSPDGQYIVTTSWDKTARVWRADGTEEPLVLRGHRDRVTSAAFSPDGQYIVTASIDGSVLMWRMDRPEALHRFEGHKGPVESVAFSPDGEFIVTASADGTGRVWRVDATEAPRVLEGHRGPVESAAFSPDGKSIVTASTDGTVRVWRADGAGNPSCSRDTRGRSSPPLSARMAGTSFRHPGTGPPGSGRCPRTRVRPLKRSGGGSVRPTGTASTPTCAGRISTRVRTRRGRATRTVSVRSGALHLPPGRNGAGAVPPELPGGCSPRGKRTRRAGATAPTCPGGDPGRREMNRTCDASHVRFIRGRKSMRRQIPIVRDAGARRAR